MWVIQAIPVAEKVPELQPERNILLILWWAFPSLLKSQVLTSPSSINMHWGHQCSRYNENANLCFFVRYLVFALVIWHLSLKLSFNSCFRPPLGYPRAGRKSVTAKEDATMSTTTPEPPPGYDLSFRWASVGLLTDIDVQWHSSRNSNYFFCEILLNGTMTCT